MRKLLCLMLFVLMASQASGYIGVIPSQETIGTVERGETYEFDVYVTSDTTAPIEIQPQASRMSVTNLENLENVNYFEMEDYSAEPVEPWIEFSENSYTIRPVDDSYEVEGREVNANISYELDVPRGAEPGYHAVNIDLNPQFDSGEGTSVRTVGLSSYSLFFRVPGEVNRELEVSDVEALRSDEDSMVVRADITNTGSVTTLLRGDSLQVAGSGVRDEVSVGGTYVEPGETETLETTWSSLEGNIEAGNYQITGSLDYITGQAFIQETVSITDFIQIQPSQQGGSGGSGVIPSGQDGGSMPIFLIVMFLVIVGSMMYAFEIDPLLIIMAMGVVGASSVIYFSSLPIYFVGVVLMAAGVLFYYGWL